MISTAFLAAGSLIPVIWGLAHIIPTRAVVSGFGPISLDNQRILTMEWVAEGITLVFLGVLSSTVLLALGPSDGAARLVLRASAAMLLVMAAWTALTGARTSLSPIKLCPVVKSLAAACLLFGTLG
jgi:hypothetical protein